MPLMPVLEWATDLAASSARLSASGEAISGLLAPLRTAMPMPERARSRRLAATTLPPLIRSSTASAVRMARSPPAPASSSLSRPFADPQVMTDLVPVLRSNSGTSSSITDFMPLVQRTFIVALLRVSPPSDHRRRSPSVGLDQHPAALDHGLVGLDRHHAGRRHHRAGLDVELAVVERTLDHVALDETFGEQARPVGAVVVDDVKLAVQVEDGDRQIRRIDLQRGPGRDLVGATEIDTGRHAFTPR